MGHDKTEPRTKRIIGLGVLSLVTLGVVHFTLKSYFISMTETEMQAKITSLPNELRVKVEADQAAKIGSGRPIESAISELSSGRPSAITPMQTQIDSKGQPLNDSLAPMKGWEQTKQVFTGFGVVSAETLPTIPSDIPVAGQDAGPAIDLSADAAVMIPLPEAGVMMGDAGMLMGPPDAAFMNPDGAFAAVVGDAAFAAAVGDGAFRAAVGDAAGATPESTSTDASVIGPDDGGTTTTNPTRNP